MTSYHGFSSMHAAHSHGGSGLDLLLCFTSLLAFFSASRSSAFAFSASKPVTVSPCLRVQFLPLNEEHGHELYGSESTIHNPHPAKATRTAFLGSYGNCSMRFVAAPILPFRIWSTCSDMRTVRRRGTSQMRSHIRLGLLRWTCWCRASGRKSALR